MSETPTFWWSNRPNFGDRLTVPILQSFGLTPRWAAPERAKLVVVGSVLEMLPDSYDGVIAGAGKLMASSSPVLTSATVKGVRGPLTAKLYKDVAIGDPGLLVSDLVQRVGGGGVGVVPHWSDTQLSLRYPSYRTISPAGDPLSVLQEIAQCDFVIASSLHAVIAADALGISRQIELTPDYRTQGKLFKFEDYSASISTPLRVGEMGKANPLQVSARKSEVRDMLTAVAGEFNA